MPQVPAIKNAEKSHSLMHNFFSAIINRKHLKKLCVFFHSSCRNRNIHCMIALTTKGFFGIMQEQFCWNAKVWGFQEIWETFTYSVANTRLLAWTSMLGPCFVNRCRTVTLPENIFSFLRQKCMGMYSQKSLKNVFGTFFLYCFLFFTSLTTGLQWRISLNYSYTTICMSVWDTL